MTKGAVNFHFPDKCALADGVVAASLQVWQVMVAEVGMLGHDPLSTLVIQIRRSAELMSSDPVVNGGIRLLSDPLSASRKAHAFYIRAEAAVTAQFAAAASAGLLREPVRPERLATTVIAAVMGHNLICERTGSLDKLPARIDAMWHELLPRIATESWILNTAGGFDSEADR